MRLLGFAVVTLVVSSAVQAEDFRELDNYRPNNQYDWPSYSYQISDDGRFATGYAGFGGVVRWDYESLTMLWGVPEQYRVGGMAGGISGDGQTVAGTYLEDTNNDGLYDLVTGRIWNGGNVQHVPGLQTTAQVWVQDVSLDGSTVVGYNTFSGDGFQEVSSVFRYNANSGLLEDLGPVPGLSTGTQIRSDGSGDVVIASGLLGGYWTSANGWSSFSGLLTEAHEVSDDGRLIIGKSKFGGGNYRGMIFDWQAGVMTDVGTLYEESVLYSITADGKTAVGVSGGTLGGRAVWWKDGVGFSDLNIEFAGIIPTGWILYEATDITPDGRYILGTGTDENGVYSSWVIDTIVPEPTTLLATAAGAILLAGRRRRAR